MKVRYVGGLDPALVCGKIVHRGEIIDLPSKIAHELIARGDCEAVKAEKTKREGGEK